MAKYRLHVEETVSRLNFIDVETELNSRELDALLNKIENGEISGALSLKRKLETQGVKVKSISFGLRPFYKDTKTLEIEELKEPKKQGFMLQCKTCDLTREDIEQAIEAARERMIESISENGMTATKTVKLSQELDILIVAQMSKQ